MSQVTAWPLPHAGHQSLAACGELLTLGAERPATSWQALGVAGEVRLPVPPMPVPAGEAVPVEQVLGSEAVWLFSERAAAVVPGFEVDADNAGPVLQLCQRLDGIPPALELAAVRLGALSLDQLNHGLRSELSVLGSANRGAEARQQTLEATIGWSYRLLNEAERALWARLSVFAGGFDADAATEVCSGPPVPPERVVEVLGALVESRSSNATSGAGNAPRYWLLDTLGQFGKQRLREMGEQASIQERHLQWVGGLARPLAAFDRHQAESFRRLDTERDNLWAALDLCVKQPAHADTAGQMAMHLIIYWGPRGSFSDVRRVVSTVSETAPENSQARARLLVLVAIVALLQNDWDAGYALADQIRRMATRLKDHELMAWSLDAEALPLFMSGRAAEAIERGESAVTLARTMHDQPLNLVVTASFCPVLVAAGQLDRAIELGEPALAESRQRGELWARGYLLNALCQVRWRQGDTELAEAMAREGAACKHAVQDQNGLQALLETLAWMTAGRGAHERAAMLLGCAEQVRQASGIPFQELYRRQQHDESVALTIRALGQDAFEAAYQLGLAMPVDDTLGIAAPGNHRQPPKPAPTSRGAASLLTRREREIAALIAEELTTREIAGRLFLSERTVEAHVTHIFNKLGVNSRAQLIRWLASTAGAGSAEPGQPS